MARGTIYEGIVVGLAGATAVAVWFLLFDLVAGAPLRTPALLGAALFHGLRDPAALRIGAAPVLEYTVVHGAAFLAFGMAAAGLFAMVDQERRVLFAIFMLFCCFEVAFILALLVTGEWLVEELSLWSILAGNVVAALVMLGILFRRHHRMLAEMLSVGE